MKDEFWRGRPVLVTGHTGFKGSWLALWLHKMGAHVYGYSLAPSIKNGIYIRTRLTELLAGEAIHDIRSGKELGTALNNFAPEVIFHLAAQPIVRESYSDPFETFSINAMGLINLFENVRYVNSVKAIVNITSDKCYLNNESGEPFRESDKLGGRDPYSASKACAELITTCYRESFFANSNIQLATARAGNVIGGGDYALDRLIPDFLRSIDKDEELLIRNPNAKRPWQHVLEPVSGYLELAKQLLTVGDKFADAWNFGPELEDNMSVRDIVEVMISLRNRGRWGILDEKQVYEAQNLFLDSFKSKQYLGWRSRWRVYKALIKTMDWHEANVNGKDMLEFSLQQIEDYEVS